MNIFDLYKNLCTIISENENASPEFEADELIEFTLKEKRLNIPKDTHITQENCIKLLSLAKKRSTGYPLQYILGSWQFFDLNLHVGEGVLIPRSDTECVCEAAFKYIKQLNSPNVLDLCSGSGAIALAIKKYCPTANVAALEKSEKAYSYLVKNIQSTKLNVLPIKADLFTFDENIEDETFDVIISNPPYISQNLQGKLQKEVSFEPEMALFTTDEGVRFYKYIAEFYYKKIKSHGYLIFEYGYDQKDTVKAILYDFGFKAIEEIVDLGGNPRGIITQK